MFEFEKEKNKEKVIFQQNNFLRHKYQLPVITVQSHHMILDCFSFIQPSWPLMQASKAVLKQHTLHTQQEKPLFKRYCMWTSCDFKEVINMNIKMNFHWHSQGISLPWELSPGQSSVFCLLGVWDLHKNLIRFIFFNDEKCIFFILSYSRTTILAQVFKINK